MLSQLFGEGAVLFTANPSELSEESHYPEERAAVTGALEKRRREYYAVRALARRAFDALGVPPSPLLNREDRSPVWPVGLVGSLTHTEGFCAVVVAAAERYRALGLDAECTDRVGESLFERVLTPRERGRVGALPRSEQASAATLLFSAKESLYKCQFPLTQTFVGFHEVEVDLDLPAQRFQARFLTALPGLPSRPLDGRFALLPGHVVTAVALDAAP